jgi:hypothetical protein
LCEGVQDAEDRLNEAQNVYEAQKQLNQANFISEIKMKL